MQRYSLLTASLLALVGCGYTDGGSGSKSLEVQATLEYRLDQNAVDANVEVRKDGLNVEGAVVVITDGDSGDKFTLEQHDNGNHVNYVASIAGYHRKMAVRVESGSDDLHGQLEGPGTHKVTNPDQGDILDRSDLGSEMTVRWSTEDGISADEVTIHFHEGDYETSIQDDHGKASVPTSKLATGPERVRVTRWNRVNLAGGILASVLEIGYSVENEVVVQD